MSNSSIIVRTADVVDKLGADALVLEPGHMRSYGGLTVFGGMVETVHAPEDNVILREALSEPGDSRVLVVDGNGSLRVGLLGGNVASLALSNGWAGCVIYGCVRDAAELASIPLGIYAIATCPRKSSKSRLGSRGKPTDFLGVQVEPGDFLYADEDGVVIAKRKA